MSLSTTAPSPIWTATLAHSGVLVLGDTTMSAGGSAATDFGTRVVSVVSNAVLEGYLPVTTGGGSNSASDTLSSDSFSITYNSGHPRPSTTVTLTPTTTVTAAPSSQNTAASNSGRTIHAWSSLKYGLVAFAIVFAQHVIPLR